MLRDGSEEKERENEGARASFTQWAKLKRGKRCFLETDEKLKNVQHHN